MSALKPCPLCGGRALFDESEKTNETMVGCPKAKLAQPRADRWRLISDTTPRDGSRLLLWYPPIRIEDGVAAEGFWSSQYAGDWMPSRGSAALGRHERRPTHWMPLPQGPALGGGR